MNNTNTTGDTVRHPAVQNLLNFFSYEHLPAKLKIISKPCADLALQMANSGLEGTEFTVGLRKLLEAKDCFVRAQLSKKEDQF